MEEREQERAFTDHSSPTQSSRVPTGHGGHHLTGGATISLHPSALPKVSVLILLGCYNKTTMAWVAYKQQRKIFLSALEAGSAISKRWEIQYLVCAHFLTHRRHLLTVATVMDGQAVVSAANCGLPGSYKDTHPLRGPLFLCIATPQRANLLVPSHCGPGFIGWILGNKFIPM